MAGGIWWTQRSSDEPAETLVASNSSEAEKTKKIVANSPARAALERYRKKGLQVPLSDDPVQRNRVLSQRIARKKAQLRSYDEAEKQLRFEAPEMLRKLDPEAAAEWDDRHRVQEEWRREIEGEVETLRQLRDQMDSITAAQLKRQREAQNQNKSKSRAQTKSQPQAPAVSGK